MNYGDTKMEIAIMIAFLVLWIALQAWILPRFGVSTGMSGACKPSSAASDQPRNEVLDDTGDWERPTHLSGNREPREIETDSNRE
jgi:hypothetical protein